MRNNIEAEVRALAVQMQSSAIGYQEAMERFEAAYVGAAVQECEGNQCKAASLLGIHRNTVTRILARSRRWVCVYRLSTGRMWPRQILGESDQAACCESQDNEHADRLRA